jgi:hypothetical protein
LDIKSIAKTLTYKMTSRASAGKKSRAPCEPRLMSHCDFQAQLKSPLKAVGTHHYVHLDGFDLLPADATAKLVAAESLAQITRGDRYKPSVWGSYMPEPAMAPFRVLAKVM